MAKHMVARSIVVDAPAKTIFDLVASPSQHALFDGSGTVQEAVFGTERLAEGAEFGMDMKMLGVPYRITNRVVEFEENRLIAWKHSGTHRWRYEFAELAGGRTVVTETFDYSRGLAAFYILTGAPARNARGIEQTLERLKNTAESEVA